MSEFSKYSFVSYEFHVKMIIGNKITRYQLKYKGGRVLLSDQEITVDESNNAKNR